LDSDLHKEVVVLGTSHMNGANAVWFQ
jgi:hypothetical protein